MSLLQSQDFVLNRLRTGHLANVRDGVSERMISITSLTGGRTWSNDTLDSTRANSPPIPTGITSGYLKIPRTARGSRSKPTDNETSGVRARAASSPTPTSLHDSNFTDQKCNIATSDKYPRESHQPDSANTFDPSKQRPAIHPEIHSPQIAQVVKRDEPDGAESDDSLLSSEIAGSGDSASFLCENKPSHEHEEEPTISTFLPVNHANSPLPDLPPPRCITRPVAVVSTLTQALMAHKDKPPDPLERFSVLDGKTDANPLYIKVYAPFSRNPSKAIEMVMRQYRNEETKVTVADAIGLALWRYGQEGREPELRRKQMNVNRWTLRVAEDEEVDFDFPALSRIRPMVDFTSNNQRAIHRNRFRDKPWDEFALVEADEKQWLENQSITPQYSTEPTDADHRPDNKSNRKPPNPSESTQDIPNSIKKLKIYYGEPGLLTRSIYIYALQSRYISEVLDEACKKFMLEKALYTFEMRDHGIHVPTERIVKALGEFNELNLVRRKYIGEGIVTGGEGCSGLISASEFIVQKSAVLREEKKVDIEEVNDIMMFKKFNVTRKQGKLFSSSTGKILAMDNEYIYMMSSERVTTGGITRTALFEGGKSRRMIHFSSIVGCKMSGRNCKIFRIVVMREREIKRYEFEAASSDEAGEIVREIRAGVERFKGVVVL